MKELVGAVRVLFGVVLIAACTESPTEPEPVWVFGGQWGVLGLGNGQLQSPNGISVAPNGNVYVADTSNDRIQYFTATGSYLGKWGSPGTGGGQFYYPSDVAVGPNGNVYVIVYIGELYPSNLRIQYFTPTGSYLGQWGSCGTGKGQLSEPGGLAVAGNGNVYVADTYNHRIQFFTPNGLYLGHWGTRGSGDGEFDSPYRVAVAPDGKVYVADAGNHRVQYFTTTGSFLGKWGSEGSDRGEFLWLSGVAVSPAGAVFTVDYRGGGWWHEEEFARVQYFNASGAFLGMWGTVGPGEGQFLNPSGIAVSPVTGYVFVADAAQHRIQYFRRK